MRVIREYNIAELQQLVAHSDDDRAYRQLFFIFYKPLVRFAVTFVGDRQTAEEVVSDVFIRIWEKRRTILPVDNLRVYLYISTKNTALNYIARSKKMRSVDMEQLAIDLPSTNLSPEQLMITSEMAKKIDYTINRLPQRCKLVFKLVKDDGLPYKEVAQILNISVKTIDNQLAIALRKIAGAINLRLPASKL